MFLPNEFTIKISVRRGTEIFLTQPTSQSHHFNDQTLKHLFQEMSWKNNFSAALI